MAWICCVMEVIVARQQMSISRCVDLPQVHSHSSGDSIHCLLPHTVGYTRCAGNGSVPVAPLGPSGRGYGTALPISTRNSPS